MSRYLTHTDRSTLQQSLFHLDLRKRSIPLYRGLLILIGSLILVTWPSDFEYFSNPELVETYFNWRLITLSWIAVFLGLMTFSDLVRRNIYSFLYAGILVELVLTGYLFGEVESLNLRHPWFYISYIIPFMTIIINVRLCRRITATFLLPAVYVASFLQLRTGPDYWGYTFNHVNLNIIFSAFVLSVLLGHFIYHLHRSNYLQSRQLRIQQRRIQELANYDLLTDLYNRREFESLIEEEFDRSQRYDKTMSIVMLDLDHFKKINDTYGHQAGDEVLEAVGDIIKEETRNSDISCRYGGEEFAVVLTETPLKDAHRITERLRQRLASRTFESVGETFSVTCSAGITELNETDQSIKEALKRADEALYDAKAKGRDCVMCYQ